MSDDYEVGITLALTDDASVGIAVVQRDLLLLDQAMAQSAVGLAELRAFASIALRDADVEVRRAAGLAAAPLPAATARPAKAEVPPEEAPAAPGGVQMKPTASAAVAPPMAPAAMAMPVPRAVTPEREAESKTMVAPQALPVAAAPAAPMAEPVRPDSVTVPAAPSLPPNVVEVERARPSVSAAAAAPMAFALPSAPLAAPPLPVAPAAAEAGVAAASAAPVAAPITGSSFARPAAPIVMPVPVSTEAMPSPALPQQRSAAPVTIVERVTTRDMPRTPELAEIGRSAMPSRPVEAQRAPVQPVAVMAAAPDAAAVRPEPELADPAWREDPRDGRMQGAPMDRPRRDDGRREAAGAPMPAGNAPAAPAASAREQTTMSGDVILDGQKVGRWMSDRMTRDVGRPPNGPTGFDPSRSPAWPGATVA